MHRKINFKGKPVSLIGRVLKKEIRAADFRVVSQELEEVGLRNFEGKIKVITSFLSLDTSVCDAQLKEFNRRASRFTSDVVVLCISKDLPFAQKRFCVANDIKNVFVFSDYKYSFFGINYGLLIKELNLLARASIILDKNNYIRYAQIVPEIATQPDYDEVLKNLEDTIRNPNLPVKEELPSKCKPCEGEVPALAAESVEKLIKGINNWQLVEGKRLSKEFKFKEHEEARYFLDLVSIIADEQGHHPTMTLSYNKLKISLTTHAAGGLTENDFIMARIIDELGDE